jgi:hypothetical protein
MLETVCADCVVHKDKQIPDRHVVCGLCSVCLQAVVFPCSQSSLIVLRSAERYNFCPLLTETLYLVKKMYSGDVICHVCLLLV